MKKVIYVVVVLVILLVLSMLLKGNEATKKEVEAPVVEPVAVEAAPVVENAGDDVVVVDVEPTAEAPAAETPAAEAPVVEAPAVEAPATEEVTVEEVVKENPETTADEGETVVE